MKSLNYYSLIFISAIISACGGADSNTDNNLDQLISKRDSLKYELSLINDQIAELDTSKAEITPMVTTAIVEQKNFVHKVEVQGSVEADENILVTAEAQGTIRVIHVKEGQRVSKGQALVTIDSEILQSTIDEVETSLEMANYLFEKQEKLMQEGVGVEIEYEQARNQKKALEQKLKTMRSQQGKTVVRAPFSGVIDEVMVSLGEMASPMNPLMRLVNNNDVKITASLAENLLGRIKVGTPVEVLIPAMNDTVISGVVNYKGNFIDPVNRTFRIHVTVKNNSLLLANMNAKVNVVDFSKSEALVVNTNAILQDTKNNNYVYVLSKDEDDLFAVKKVNVIVEKSYNGESCITPVNPNEIKKGDQIVLKGAKGITEADKVKIQA